MIPALSHLNPNPNPKPNPNSHPASGLPCRLLLSPVIPNLDVNTNPDP